jgi:parallel beta-helix repeat protein
MNRKVAAIWVSFVMIVCFIVIIIELVPRVEAPATLYVGGTGGGNYSKIQWAIENATDGDTVFVYNGTYYENLIVNKSINLTGESRDTTIIDGGGSGIVVYVNASWVNITGFNVTESGSNAAGIQLQKVQNCSIYANNLTTYMGYQIYLVFSSNNSITGNNVFDSKFGIYLISSFNNNISHNIARNGFSIYLDSSSNNTITYNNITDIAEGITLESSYDNIIAYNNVSSETEAGIFIWKSSKNKVTNNIVTNSRRGILIAISSNNTITANNISSNIALSIESGILVASSSLNKILNNNVSNCDMGIHLLSTSNNTIFNNNVSANWEGIFLLESSNNTMINNNVSSNLDNGISIKDSFYNIVTRNNVSSNEHIGISIWNSSNNIVTGNNVSLNSFEGISVGQSFDNNITNNNISINEGGIRIEEESSNNNITGNSISFNKGFGISLISSSSNSLLNNIFIQDGVFIWGSDLFHFNTHTIPINNIVNDKPLRYYKDINGMNIDGDIIDVGELILANCTDINVENLQINNTDVGIEVAFSENCNITNNEISSSDVEGITIMFSHNNTITNNNVADINYEGDNIAQPLIDGIFLYSSSNNIVSNNNISNNSVVGIYLRSSINNTVMNNDISNNSYYGLLLETSSNNTIKDNNVTGNPFGVTITFSTNNTVNGNYIWNNELGIILFSSFNNTLGGNNISNNGTGILLYSSQSNNIIYNNVSGNLYGINLTSSSGNRIYHNNFISNINQAYDNRSDNYWDNGYPSGGNYWSDYSGVDNYKGPFQDIQGRDGIGDTNYSIDSNSIDRYPLMGPYPYFPSENYTILKQGWNLISIPLMQEEQNITRVLGSIDSWYSAAQWFNPSDLEGLWKHHKVGKPFGNDLSHLNETMGFWIYITQPGDTIFLYNGTQPTSNQSILLHPGWNMVGYPSLTSYNRTEGLNNLTFNNQVDAIWSYDAATQKWEEMGESDNFIIGRGYYIHAKSECEWEVPL